MSYHLNNLGTYADHVRPFADIDGYVPQDGDAPEDFRWDGGEPPHDWEEHVAGAVKATRIANASISRWQGTPHGELVRLAIKDSGYTQEAIAEALGVSPAAISKRLDRQKISVETVDEIARVIGWTIPEIIGE